MQIIAGVHFNYSVDEHFWPLHAEMQGWQGDLRPLIDSAYMGMVRNLQRYGWIIPYLFGASPALCKSFGRGRDLSMPELDPETAPPPDVPLDEPEPSDLRAMRAEADPAVAGAGPGPRIEQCAGGANRCRQGFGMTDGRPKVFGEEDGKGVV